MKIGTSKTQFLEHSELDKGCIVRDSDDVDAKSKDYNGTTPTAPILILDLFSNRLFCVWGSKRRDWHNTQIYFLLNIIQFHRYYVYKTKQQLTTNNMSDIAINFGDDFGDYPWLVKPVVISQCMR